MIKIQKHSVVIGGGTAGLKAYRTIINEGKTAIIIEKNDFTTTCADVGCMPSKLLIAASNNAYEQKKSKDFGIFNKGKIINDQLIMDRVRSERDRFVGFVKEGVKNIIDEDKIIGKAFIKDKNTVIVNNIEIKCETIVIATGSKTFIPDEYSHLGEKIITNNDLFYSYDLPESVAIIGSGVIALEIGQALHNLGKKVKIFSKGGNIGFLKDEEIKNYAINMFNDEFYLDVNSNILKTEIINNKVKIEYINKDNNKTEIDFFDNILIAAGRIPNLNIYHENLKFEKIKNIPKVNRKTLKTSIDNIFIAGDANNQIPLLHEASDDGYIAGINAAIYPDVKNFERKTKISIMFTTPDIMSVGLNIKDIEFEYKDNYEVGVVSFENQGIVLGAEMIGPSAEHIAHLLAWSIQSKNTVDDLLEMPFYHPVIEEGVRICLQNLKSKL